MNETGRGFSHLLVRWFLIGPHAPDPNRPPTLTETLLPWPVRLLAFITALLLGWNWAGTPLGEQLGGGLQYAGLIAVSLAVSYWWWIFLANLGLALIWLTWPLGPVDDNPFMAEVGHVVTFLNRQVGHIEVLAVWLVLSLVAADRLPGQLGMIAAVVFLGEPILSGLSVWWFFPKPRDPAVVARDLFWRRRPLFYLATLLGFVAIALLAPRQAFKLMPGVLAVAIADLFRYLRHRRFARTVVQPQHTARLQDQHDRQRRLGRHADFLLGPGLVLAGLALLVSASLWARHRYDQSLVDGQPVRGEPVDYCANHLPPAPDPDVAMFIISDSQFHELAGQRFVGQMEFADALVPVALRPIELDVLSASPLSHAATIYAALAAERPPGTRLWWAHLGDMADLSCQNEMDRSNQLLRARFDVNALAGVAPGNHDKAFTGNFFWSPYWDSACRSGRLEKALSDEKLAAAWRDAVAAAHGRMEAVPAWNPVASATRRGSALVTVTPLGLARDHQTRRGVIGIFLDSSDGQAFDLGVAGLFGTFSAQQGKIANRLVAAVRDEAGGVYQDPIYVVFLHHPVDETAPDSNRRFKDWLAALDGDGRHLLGVITAHTHEAQKHSHCVGRRMVPEIVVGSTIDPPQEASLLTVGPVADGTVALRVQTLPMVARPGKTCASRAPALTSGECQRIVAGLRGHADCAALFRSGEATALGRDCSDIEHPLEINDRLQLAARWTGPGDEDEIRADQRSRTTALWSCICRDHACTASPQVLDLDDPSYFALVRQELGRSPDREKELTCLAWAGAAVQRYKTAGMSYGDALRCAFDDETMPAAHDFIARMEVTSCY